MLFEKHAKMVLITIPFALDAGSNKNIKEIEILLKRNWNFTYHIFIRHWMQDQIKILKKLKYY